MAHIHEKIDFTVTAFIVHDQKVLLIHHKGLNRWLPIGGHIELDEDPDEALLREICEEAGIKKESLTVMSDRPDFLSEGTKFLYTPNFLDLHDISKTHKHIGLTYFLRSDTDQIALAKREHNQIKWVDKDALNDEKLNLSQAIKFYAANALKRALVETTI